MATSKRRKSAVKQRDDVAIGAQEPPMPALGVRGPTYVVYDQESGAIVGTYAVMDGDTGEYVAQKEEDVRRSFAAEHPDRAARTRRRAAPLGVLAIAAEDAIKGGHDVGGARVDIKRRRLVPRTKLALAADRLQLEGDGADAVELTVTAVDDDGNPEKGFTGEVQVITSHGKLGASGGRVKLRAGAARITLTSTAETIARVNVSARATGGDAVATSLILEFL